ncbi:22821_t:CDS:2 [Gigaspora margarita]|uniref:22821_t:CDS:1 n=1 Tax=Gigaspora margarita TaxID=4874 RepID=A0ABN7ULY4_GIGMA|nr:22821_t:CDS:2 [Gigaspora margarita]
MKEKTPQWFQNLEQTVLENKITRSIKETFIQVDKINETQIKPGKRKLLHKRSKKEWVIGKKKNSIRPFLGKVEKKPSNKKMHILEWEETDKEHLSYNSPLRSSIVPTSKILKVKENEVEDLQRYNEVAKWEKQMDINPKKKKMKKVNPKSSEGKKKENSIGKGIDKEKKGEDQCEGFENKPRKQKSEDKR